MNRHTFFPEALLLRYGYRDWRVMIGPVPDAGSVQYDQHLIILQDRQHPRDLMDTLVHELLHVIANDHALFEDEDLEERVVSAMASGLIQMLVRNPHLLAYLKERINAQNLHHGSDERTT